MGSFVGTWKEDMAKRRLVASSTLAYTFTEEADGFVTIVRSDVRLRDRVRFDGRDYATPGVPGRSVSWTKVADTVYETTIKRDGALIAKGRWTVSNDSTRLTQETTPVRVDDKSVTNISEYVRTSGERSSLLGTWTPVS
jgi:hypothetical protein